MRTLAKVATARTDAGQPLPPVFPALDRARIRPRRATVTMLAAPPASGKTLLASKWVQAMGLPTLFFSADTDEKTMAERFGAMATGDDQETVAAALRGKGAGFYSDEIDAAAAHVKFVFESDPTYAEVTEEIVAFAEAHGAFPEVVVVDNLMNLVPESDNEWGAMREHTKLLKRITRITGAAVFVLHHVNESSKDSRFPSARHAIAGKVSQLPEVIITLGADLPSGVMRLASVKNRFGPQDPSGETYQELLVDADRVQFYADKHDRAIGRGL